jgi:hypothetical protein
MGEGFESILRRAAMFALLALGACAAWAPGANAGLGAVTLSMEIDDRWILRGDTIHIEGTLDGELLGDGGKTIRLMARPYPYNSEQLVTTTTTSNAGEYEFDIKPDYNTRYRVVEQGGANAASGDRPVWVEPKNGARVRVPYPFATVRIWWGLSPELPTRVHNRTSFMYFKKTTQRRYRFVDRSRVRLVRPGRAVMRHRFRLPPGRYRFHVFGCVEFKGAPDDIGIGRPVNQNCPRKPFVPSKFFDYGSSKARGADQPASPARYSSGTFASDSHR